jgi:transcriptional regulator with XRE-family HTH domain
MPDMPLNTDLNTDLIRALREERAWSQEHLAALTGLSVRTIQRFETQGKASHESRLALASAFGVPPARLLAERDAGVAEGVDAAGFWPGWLDLSQRDVRIAVGLAAVLAAIFFIYRFGESMGQFLYYLTH